MSSEPKRFFRFGWYGDDGLGEKLIANILAGRKTATAAPSYDPEDGKVGEVLPLADKGGKVYGVVRITSVEYRPFGEFDEALAAKLGAPLEQIRSLTSFANSRPIRPEEEMRITHFELVSKKP